MNEKYDVPDFNNKLKKSGYESSSSSSSSKDEPRLEKRQKLTENDDEIYSRKRKKPRMVYNYDDDDDDDDEQKEMKNEDNINLIVHTVLEELKSKNKNQYSGEKNQNNAVEYAKEIDNYI